MFKLFEKNINIDKSEEQKEQKSNNSKLNKEIDKKKQIAEANEKHIQNVMKKSGWSHEKAVAEIKVSRKMLGIKYKDYDRYDFYKIPRENQEEEYKKIIEKREKREKQKEAHIQEVIEKTGWERGKAVSEIEEARNRFGIKYAEYVKYDFFRLNPEEQEKRFQDIVDDRERNKEKKERKAKKKEKFIQKVMENSGWSYDLAKEKMDAATALCGAEYKDYVSYKFWELDEETQKTYFTKGHANALRKKYNTNENNVAIFMNKNKFNEVFSDCMGRSWTYNKDVSLEDFKNAFKNDKKIIYKPLSASCGSGVTAFELNDNTIEKVYAELQELPLGVVEGYIIQHSEMSKYSKRSVNTIRLVTVRVNDEVHMLYAAFRMGGGDSVVDNFHSGGVLALIDTETGEVVTNAIDLSAKIYDKHPATGEVIKGFKIPYWKETVAMVKEAGKIVDGIGYVGWDIAVTENGPVLIEGNTAPAPNVLQLPYSLEGKGMYHRVEKFL